LFKTHIKLTSNEIIGWYTVVNWVISMLVKTVSQTFSTVFQSSKCNLFHMIPTECRCAATHIL